MHLFGITLMDHKDTVVIYKLCVCVLATPAMQVFAIDRMQVMNEVYILKFCNYTKHGNEKYIKREGCVSHLFLLLPDHVM